MTSPLATPDVNVAVRPEDAGGGIGDVLVTEPDGGGVMAAINDATATGVVTMAVPPGVAGASGRGVPDAGDSAAGVRDGLLPPPQAAAANANAAIRANTRYRCSLRLRRSASGIAATIPPSAAQDERDL